MFNLFCKHEWQVISEQKTESQLEQIIRLGGHVTKGNEIMMDRKLIQICQCHKCHKIKRFVEDI